MTLGEKDMKKVFSVSDESKQEKARKLRKETAAAKDVNFQDVSADFQEWLRDENRDRRKIQE